MNSLKAGTGVLFREQHTSETQGHTECVTEPHFSLFFKSC